jgi:hypothetical protein
MALIDPTNPEDGGTIAPAPQFPERVPQEYQSKMAESYTGNEGPVRFEEGIATDQDVPRDFVVGAQSGYQTTPGRPNHNLPVWYKSAQETMQERAHAGSASWIEAPTMLNDFVQGSYTDYATPHFEEVIRNGARQQRPSPTTVRD